jgi:hypothetical protein
VKIARYSIRHTIGAMLDRRLHDFLAVAREGSFAQACGWVEGAST